LEIEAWRNFMEDLGVPQILLVIRDREIAMINPQKKGQLNALSESTVTYSN
jgi:hypothetical protein